MVKKKSSSYSCAAPSQSQLATANKNHTRSTNGALSAILYLIVASLCFCSCAHAQQSLDDFKTVKSSNDEQQRSEGLTLEAPPSYIDFKGDDGLTLEVSLPGTSNFDYTIMFWFRSNKSYKELSYDDSITGDNRAYLFEIPSFEDNMYDTADKKSGAACYITNPGTGPVLRCGATGEDDFQIDLGDLPDIQSWMHLTFSSNYDSTPGKDGETFVRIDISNESFEAVLPRHMPIAIDQSQESARGQVYYGAGFVEKGFPSHYRQFWMTLGFMKDRQRIQYLKHQYKVMDYSTLGYYKFEQNEFHGRYADAFRNQTAVPISEAPIFQNDNIAAPFCNSLPQKFEQIPYFFRSAGTELSNLEIPRFWNKDRQISYTVSFWMKNFGQHSYGQTPIEGRENNHLIKMDEVFAIWYDSPTSIRVYVYARNNYDEVYSSTVFLPLFEWVNIQIQISQADGIRIQTFNQNGERQQKIHNKVFLSTQYPSGSLDLFQSFIGVPYQLHIWQTSLDLPINLDPFDKTLPQYDDLIVSYDFTKNYYQILGGSQPFEGWQSQLGTQGEKIDAVEGEGFQFIYANVPSETKFEQDDNQEYFGQFKAKSTTWNGVTCPSPENSQMYLGSEDKTKSKEKASFSTAILVDKTSEYTVEFWFKANTDVNLQKDNKRNGKSVTFLYQMEDTQSKDKAKAMDIYVEDGRLKCAPFGYDITATDDDNVLVYDIKDSNNNKVDVLKVKEWQHISCIYINDIFVRGQYLRTNLNIDALEFQENIKMPLIFAKSMKDVEQVKLNENLVELRRWQVTLGAKEEEQYFAGSFKDLRLWKSARSDAELYSYRFVQVKNDPNLAGNLKFMDGNPHVFNNAVETSFSNDFASIEPSMLLMKSDKENLICPTDTYFDPKQRMCTRYPFPNDGISIVYYVNNNFQHGHNMIMRIISYSSMFLPGDFQPQTRQQWSMVNDDTQSNAVTEKYFFNNNEKAYYNFDPIFMGDFTKYKFQLKVNDEREHNFFANIEQEIRPRQCVLVIDSITKQADNEKSKVLTRKARDDEDFSFSFYVERIDGCNDSVNSVLQPEVLITSQPQLDDEFYEKIQKQVVFDAASQKFTVLIDNNQQHSKEMIKNLPINMIFTVFWKYDQNEYAYMNVLYKLTFISMINVDLRRHDIINQELQTETDNIVDINKKKDLVLDASKTVFASQVGDLVTSDSQLAQGISFRWECAKEGENQFTFLNDYCQRWKGSPVLQIPNKMFEDTIEWINKSITIKVIASSIETSEISDSIQQEASFQFTWVSSVGTEFEIKPPNKCTGEGCPNSCKDEVGCLLLVTVEQEVEVVPINSKFIAGDGYLFSYDLENNQTGDSVVKKDLTSSKSLLIEPNTLDENSFYKLTVTVENPSFEFIDPMTETFNLYTSRFKPTIDVLDINPIKGEMFKTNFTIIMSDYDPEGMTYELYGITQDDSELKLSDNANNNLDDITKQTRIENKILPELKQIKVILTTIEGEIVEKFADVAVVKEGDETWAEIAETQRLNQDSDINTYLDSNLWQNYQSIGAQANSAARISGTEESALDAFEVNKKISDYAFADIIRIPKNWDQETSDQRPDVAVDYMVLTIGKVATFSEFLTPQILQTMTETVEYILRIDQIIALIIDNKDQRTDFVNTIGNLMQQLSKQANVAYLMSKYNSDEKPNITWTRRLQDDAEDQQEDQTEVDTASEENTEDQSEKNLSQDDQDLLLLRDLMNKLTVVKNSFLDLVCKSETIQQIEGNQIEIYGEQTEFVVTLQSLNFSNLADSIQISSKDKKVEVTIPADEVLSMTRADSEAEWVCYQLSFSNASPVAGYTINSQYFFEDKPFIQLGTLDNTDKRLIDVENGGIQDLENRFVIEFDQEFTREANFYNGQTICAHYDGTVSKPDRRPWSDLKYNFDEQDEEERIDCETDYNFDQNKIVCRCSQLFNYYYAVITDLEKELIEPIVYQNIDHTILWAITFTMIFLGLTMPLLMVFLDKSDYQKVEDNYYDVNDFTIFKLQYSRQYICKQEIYYREKEIARYTKLQALRSGSIDAFLLFVRTQHPYISLFTHFDYRMKRLTRFGFVLGQWSMITILQWICFSKIFDEAGLTEFMSDRRMYYLSFFLSLLTLPMPRRCCCFFKTQMYLLHDPEEDQGHDDDEEKQAMKNHQVTDADEGDQVNPTVRSNRSNRSKGTAAVDPLSEDIEEKLDEYEHQPVLFDRWLHLKCVLVFFIFVFWALAIVTNIILGDFSGTDADHHKGYIYSFAFLTSEEAEEFAICWFLATMVWGTLINFIRVFVIALLAPIRAHELFEKEQELQKRKQKEKMDPIKFKKIFDDFHKKSLCNKASCKTCCLIPPESVEIALDVIYTIKIEKLRKKWEEGGRVREAHSQLVDENLYFECYFYDEDKIDELALAGKKIEKMKEYQRKKAQGLAGDSGAKPSPSPRGQTAGGNLLNTPGKNIELQNVSKVSGASKVSANKKLDALGGAKPKKQQKKKSKKAQKKNSKKKKGDDPDE